jgi:hypothetical protein
MAVYPEICQKLNHNFHVFFIARQLGLSSNHIGDGEREKAGGFETLVW